MTYVKSTKFECVEESDAARLAGISEYTLFEAWAFPTYERYGKRYYELSDLRAFATGRYVLANLSRDPSISSLREEPTW